jgi:xylulokinase
VLLPKDYLRLRLTGEAVSEMSDASGTLWLDVGARRWSPEMLAATGLNEAHMPRLVEGSAVSAALRTEVAVRWGLQPGIPVAGGGGDNAASAVGMGTVEPGQGFVSLGTSGVIFVSTDRFLPNPAQALHAFCHALPGRWHQMSVMLSAASAVSWATRVLGLADEAALLRAAQSLAPDARDRTPIFLPYLSGERSPHNHPEAQGVWFGLTHAHDASALAHAVVEGVNLGLLDGVRTLALPPEIPVHSLSLVGGGARSAWWAQQLADTLDVPLQLHEGGEAGGALGAARLAWLADGGAVPEVCRLPPVRQTLVPEPQAHARLMARHQRFTALYRAVRDQFQA